MIFQKSRLFLLPVLILISTPRLTGRDIQDSTFVSRFAKENDHCFSCHGQEKYTYTNQTLGKEVNALMCSNFIIKRTDFYRSNHRSFACTDCHSKEYVNFPHAPELRMEQLYECMDCHGGDPKFAQYHFEKIDSEYLKSIHYKLEPKGFSCWKCHNPHSYRITARTRKLKETIPYDNAICLNCHSNYSNFQLLTSRTEINLVQKHDWLPDQAVHFANVRCIECHARLNDSILVSHLIKPATLAVKQCNECHSQSSLLMASLYKYESRSRRKDGFLNGIILNQSYVIGANRNQFLNFISFGILFLVLIVIAVHIAFRASKRKNNN